MLRPFSTRSARILSRHVHVCNLSSSSSASSSHQPNSPVELDPSFQALLNDVDLSVLKHRARHGPASTSGSNSPRELEVIPVEHVPDTDYLTSEDLDSMEDRDEKDRRKSPAALFGSQRIGAVVIPFELQQTINRLISESDKPMLHADAERLFLDENGESAEWNVSFDKKYKSRRQAYLQAERDGTAFASVALPAHYSVLCSVIDHIKQRLGSEWKVNHVIDWGSGTGSGLWASTHSFQKSSSFSSSETLVETQLSQSAVLSYLGIDKRDGLVNIGKRLLKDINTGDTNVTWKRSFQGSEPIVRSENGEILALSAFLLSTLPSPVARKTLLKEIWESGADIIVLIDHSSKAGFEAISEAREFLLRKGRQQLDDPTLSDLVLKGSHVVAPCPHDGACPLYQAGSSKLICGFSQRLQRPDFVRKTKHSGIGHEDTGYSYVVIRRGVRPTRVHTKVGRIGEVGRRELEKPSRVQAPISELNPDGEQPHSIQEASIVGADSGDIPTPANEEITAALRAEAYSWPRLVFPPLKKSGHIIMDGCTHEVELGRYIPS
ncbi:unnamed protein product [Somion occarium]|uniref:Rsm22-domain-containing protein n=1 Tax=Somion occarium TaxID=3059160 RepID=A0ABP1CHW2_9APHY